MLFCDTLACTQPYSEANEFKNGRILIFSALEIKAIGPSEAEIWRQKGPYLPQKRSGTYHIYTCTIHTYAVATISHNIMFSTIVHALQIGRACTIRI